MVDKKSLKRNFNGMSYREVQRANSKNRDELLREDKNWIKENNYRNTGWSQVIDLYQKIEEFLNRYLKIPTLEELFLEADYIGNKYLTNQEIQEFNQKLSEEVNKIEEEIDKQFPDVEIEVVDFSTRVNRLQKKHN